MSNDPSTAPAPPQPTAEHERLKQSVGEWEVQAKFYMDPSQPPMEVQAHDTIRMFGPFWTESDFRAEMFGAPFRGRCTLGYDPHAGCWISTWIDVMAPIMYRLTGNFDAADRVLEMTGDGIDCMSGGEASYRTTEEHKSPDERVFEMFMTPKGGSELKLFTHVYRRVK